MTRIIATAIGVVLAAGLAIAAPTDNPEDLVNRVLAANSEQELAATWKSWHPDAVHTIKMQIGMGQPDWDLTYRLADWENQPNWMDDSQVKEAMIGYKELSRSEPKITVKTENGKTLITAKTSVDYEWADQKGRMAQTDRFEITKLLGRPVIRSLSTVYDYR
ncbi:hypothetical protein [Ruegeria lacuscaerulensis]|uniref:hypothetical protein n=1 Tax=Ruegeria lacuscaerulensis TaxID=55218 RepID=UPI00147C6551|nr:hypothetical protein [Ruegeria lacuscaerulensis]